MKTKLKIIKKNQENRYKCKQTSEKSVKHNNKKYKYYRKQQQM